MRRSTGMEGVPQAETRMMELVIQAGKETGDEAGR